MLAQDHIVAYIESSAPEYAKLLDISRQAKSNWRVGIITDTMHAGMCLDLARTTYQTMLYNGSASRDDLYSAADLLKAALLLAEWQEPDAELRV